MSIDDYGNFDYKAIQRHRKRLRITQQELAEWLGQTRYSIIAYENGKLPKDIPKKLIEFLSIKTKPELYGNPIDDYGMEYQRLSNGNFKLEIPYVPISDYPHFAKNLDIDSPTFSIIVNEINTGTYKAFEIRGNAMDNGTHSSLRDGDVVIGREVSTESLKEKVSPLALWVIILEEDIICRKIAEYDKDKDKFVFTAMNPSVEYGAILLNSFQIKKAYQITKKIANL